MQCRNKDGCKKLNRHLKAELSRTSFQCTRGCGQEILYEKFHDHEDSCDGVLVASENRESMIIPENSKLK